MGFALTDDVRIIGKLPDAGKIADGLVYPHLMTACRKLRQWIGDYESETDMTAEKRDALKEAECCLCMYYLLPSLNTFYAEGLSGMQKEIGEMPYVFHNPRDLQAITEQWINRARDIASEYIPDFFWTAI